MKKPFQIAVILSLLLCNGVYFTGCFFAPPPTPQAGRTFGGDDPVNPDDPEPPPVEILLVINEIKIGVAAGTDSDEFIELYNPTDSDINLSDGNVRIERAASGGDPSTICDFTDGSKFLGGSLPQNLVVPARGYYLIVNENASSILPSDAIVLDSSMILDTSDVVYIGTDAISSPTDTDIIDFVGYGTVVSPNFEGTGPAPEITAGQSIQRKTTGQDTDDNSADFEVLFIPTPTYSGIAFAPRAYNVSISGAPIIGLTLTGHYSYLDMNGDAEAVTTFRWLRADTSTGTFAAISGATSLTYVLTAADENKYIRFEVTPMTAVAPAAGIPVPSNATLKISLTPPPATHLVINEVRYGTGSEEFIELYNPTGSDINLTASGYRIESSTGPADPSLMCDFNSSHFAVLNNAIVPAGGYYLITNEDASIGLKGIADAVLLTSRPKLSDDNMVYLGTDTINGASDPDIVDFVGWHLAGYHEGAAAPDFANGESIQRKGLGQDVDDNLYDFEKLVLPTPTNAGYAIAPRAWSVSISGTTTVGGTLTGNYTYADYNGDAQSGTTFRWLSAASSGGPYTTVLGSATTYVLQPGDTNQYIVFEVTPKTTVAPTTGTAVLSTEVGPITIPATPIIPYSNGFENGDFTFTGSAASVKRGQPGDAGTTNLAVRTGTYFFFGDSTATLGTRWAETSDYLPLLNSNAVNASLWVKGRSDCTIPLTCRLRLYWFNDASGTPNGTRAFDQGVTDTFDGTAYKQISISFSPPDGSATHVKFRFEVQRGDATAKNINWSIDDVSITQP